jgi:hypothetical protein
MSAWCSAPLGSDCLIASLIASLIAPLIRYERMEQRAFGLLCEELLERHDGSDTPLLDRVREAARLAAAESPAERPGFSALAKLLVEDGTGADGPIAPPIGRALRRGGGRPRSTFGRVLPRDHPHNQEV